MNKYQELKDRQQKEFNAFPLGVAFSKEQFANMMAKWNLTVNDTNKICSLGAGCYIRKCDIEAYKNIGLRFKQELDDAIAADPTGDGFIYDMFYMNLPTMNIALRMIWKIRLTHYILQPNRSKQINAYTTVIKTSKKSINLLRPFLQNSIPRRNAF